MFRLDELSKILNGTIISGEGFEDTLVSSVTCNTKDVCAGSLFVAISGVKVDGHSFVSEAVAKGASAVVVERAEAVQGPAILVKNSRAALSLLAAHFQEYPTRQMKLVGVTGTNGKTTTVWIIYHALKAMGVSSFRLGTLGYENSLGDIFPDTLTTPDPLLLQSLFSKALSRGIEAGVMEVSSHALHQLRVEDVAFNIAVFTNLTRDHLDYHTSMEDYFHAKSHLFDLVERASKSPSAVICNLDDPWCYKLYESLKVKGRRNLSFGRQQESPIRIIAWDEREHVSELELELEKSKISFSVPFIGEHNAENVTAAFAALYGLNYPLKSIIECLGMTPQVPGRLERVGSGDIRIFVDYAHTPDALQRALTTVKPSSRGRVWVVFGCGGDRDRGKRPEMGRIAAQLANQVVVTSDNPRTEKPEDIINEILSANIANVTVESDRSRAIELAVTQAASGDTILIAGKGHEDYQIVGTTKHHFSDQEEARDALVKRASRDFSA